MTLPFASFFDFVAKVRPDRDELESLILCGALDSLHSNRREMLWAIPKAMQWSATIGGEAGSFAMDLPEPTFDPCPEDLTPEERAIQERRILGMDIHRHLMAFERERVQEKGGLTTQEVKKLPDKAKAIVVGNPIRLRFPPTPSGKRVVFFDLEDETGLLNVTCFDAVYRRYGHAIVCSPYITIVGRCQDRDGCPAFLAQQVYPYRSLIEQRIGELQELPLKTADFLVG
ncbi:MAG: Error-prone DNA polymerase [Fimbriimonadaceae bacterium]|nr:Error-prone DNA polymerase [Fimbriimonadaceae bacterium]